MACVKKKKKRKNADTRGEGGEHNFHNRQRDSYQRRGHSACSPASFCCQVFLESAYQADSCSGPCDETGVPSPGQSLQHCWHCHSRGLQKQRNVKIECKICFPAANNKDLTPLPSLLLFCPLFLLRRLLLGVLLREARLACAEALRPVL